MSIGEMVEAAQITEGDQVPVVKGESEEIKAIKAKPLWNFDFSNVEGAPVTFMGEHADTADEAKAEVSKRLEALMPSAQ